MNPPTESDPRDEFHTGNTAGTTALVVEDDFVSALALSALLERGELNSVVAQSGYGALDALEERDDIGIVLMDIGMPVMDGYATIAAIRRRPRFVGLPIIAVTGKGDDERSRCLVAGAAAFVRKPVDPAELLGTISALLTPPDADAIEDLGF
jgi:CheY-like chemotaxis protein